MLALSLAPLLLLGGVCHRTPAHPARPSAAVVFNGPPSPSPSVAAAVPSPSPLPASVFIKVPYTPQAPYNNWDSAHEDYCEAAAALMYGAYLHGDKREVIPPAEADRRMGQIVDWERAQWPGVLNLPIADVAKVVPHFYGSRAVIGPVSLTAIKTALAAGHPVIVPLMTHGAPGGQKINPNYGRVNVYHVLLITGYGPGYLVTNDAGIVQGENWRYSWTVISSAIKAQVPVMHQPALMLYFT